MYLGTNQIECSNDIVHSETKNIRVMRDFGTDSLCKEFEVSISKNIEHESFCNLANRCDTGFATSGAENA